MKIEKFEQSGFIIESEKGFRLGLDIGSYTPVEKLDGIKVDAMIVSHLHRDHLSPDQIKKLSPEKLYISYECQEALGEDAISSEIVTIKTDSQVQIGDIKVEIFSVDHGPNVPQPKENFGFLFTVDDQKIYFPGDIFYIHSRMLERATHLSKERGGGSLTALPIIETEAQDISAYIPTNLISITDGQIYLSPSLFQLGVLPAVDVGKSVSRVGGEAQWAAYRAVAGDLKLAYAQFEELETFARFGARLDDDTRKIIEHGRRIRACLKQPEFAPVSVPAQITVLLALTANLFDPVPLEQMTDAGHAVQEAAAAIPAEVNARFETASKLNDEDRKTIIEIARKALAPFQPKPEPKPEVKVEPKTETKDEGEGKAEAKPKPEPPKQEIAKKTETPPPPVEKPVVEPPKSKPTPQAPPVKDVAQNRPALIVPTAPPPAAIESGFIFEGGRAVETSSDPVAIYRGLVEYSLYSYWNSPKNVTDPRIYAEVEILVDEHGNVSVAGWKQASGNKSWDASIREVFQQVHKLRNPPPSGFPHTMVVRFDMAVREQLKNI